MTNIKLYTEEQVRRALQEMTTLSQGGIEYYLSNKLTPIELPSDEEIEKLSNIRLLYLTNKSEHFRLGAKWVIEQIKEQQNEY